MHNSKYKDAKCCGCFILSTDSGMKGIFAFYFLQTLAILGLATYDVAIGAPVTVMDLLLALPGIFLLLHMCMVFRNDSAV